MAEILIPVNGSVDDCVAKTKKQNKKHKGPTKCDNSLMPTYFRVLTALNVSI